MIMLGTRDKVCGNYFVENSSFPGTIEVAYDRQNSTKLLAINTKKKLFIGMTKAGKSKI